MDFAADVRVIRAPSLKRGKSEGGLNERVSLANLIFFILLNIANVTKRKQNNYEVLDELIVFQLTLFI